MSKYIIEIKPEYEDKFKGVMILGAENSNLYVDSNTVDELEELTADYINEHFGDLQDDAYNKGYAQCQDDYSDALKHAKDTAYQKGFEDGKAVSDKGCEGCMYNDGTKEHSPCDICCNAYLNRWTAKQTDDEIKVGDEVKQKEYKNRFVVTKMKNGYIYGISEDGSWNNFINDGSFDKTGRHFDIASILEGMRND